MTILRLLLKKRLLGVTLTIFLISFSSAYAGEIPCRDLETATADELLATVDPQSVEHGGGVRIGKSECGVYPGQKGCEWDHTLEDDEMLDRDSRLIYVRSSHLTGSGTWQDLLVFGCVSGAVKKLFLGQFNRFVPDEEVFNSTPPALRSALKDYMNGVHSLPPIDCAKVVTELQMGINVAQVAKDLNVPTGSVEPCRQGAAKASSAGMSGPAAVPMPSPAVGFRPATP